MGRLTKQQSLKHSSNNEHLTIQRDYHYDALGQLTHISGRSVLQSKKRNQQNVSNNQNTFTRNHQYQYDAQGRLTEHKLTDYQNHTGITEVFAFDPASNRVPVKVADDNTDKTPNNHGRPRELIQNGKRIRYTYDSHGRVLYKTTEPTDENKAEQQKQALQLQYNANNELEKSLRIQYQGNKVIKTQTVYHYDAFGRRIAKQSEVRKLSDHQGKLTQNSKTQYKHTHMLWNSDLPIQEYSDTHVYTTIYDQGSFKPVARLMWLRDDVPEVANDEPISDNSYPQVELKPKSKIQVYHYHNDQLGTPNELTDSEGKVIWLADYEAWGNTAKVIWHEQVIDQIQVSQNELQPIRLQGQHFDEETGLHYNRFRYYDPDVGMFTSRDPIGLNGGINVFAYAPNPTGWVDPLGLVTLPQSERSLYARGVPRAERSFLGMASYSDTQVFNEWLRLEEQDKGWLNELQGLECPTRIEDIRGPNWNEVSETNEFHRPGVFEARSRETAGGHANQCVYTGEGNLMTEPPAAGSADRAACGIMYACPIHYLQDVQPFQLAERLGRVNDYYKVRPVI